MTLSLLLVAASLVIDSGDSEVLGHIAWSNPARGANRLAAFYAGLFDLPPRLVDGERMHERFAAEYTLLAAGKVANDRPIGVVFVATATGVVERVEFGTSPPLGVGDGSDDANGARSSALVLSTSDPEVAALVADYAGRIEFTVDDRASELSTRLDLSAFERRCLPPARAWAAVAALLLPENDPRREWIARADAAAIAWSRELSAVDLQIRFEGRSLAVSVDAIPVAGSRFERLVERAFRVERSRHSTSEPGLAALGTIGVELESLVAAFSADGTASPTREDRSGVPTRVRARAGGTAGRLAWILTAPCRDDAAKSELPDTAHAATFGVIRSGDECGVAFGDQDLARAPLTPILAIPVSPFDDLPAAEADAVGVVEWSIASLLAIDSGRRVDAERPSRLTLFRHGSRLRAMASIPILDLARAVPRVRVDSR